MLNKSYQHIITYALIFGATLTLAFSPFNFLPAAFISLPALLYLIEHQSRSTIWRKFGVGFAFGLGHFVTSLYWLAYPLTIEPEKFAWLIPFSVLVIPGCLSIFIGLLSLITSFFIKTRLIACIIFSSGWVIMELIRGHAILDFPWNFLGYTSVFSIYLMQIISFIGIYGLSFVIAITSTILYSRNVLAISVVYLIFCSCFLCGYLRVNEGHTDTGSIKIRIIQPNFQELHFGDLEKQKAVISKLLAMSNAPGYEDRDLIIWPESAFPFMIDNIEPIHSFLRHNVKGQGTLVLGADRYENGKAYNSIFSFSPDGRYHYYDKKKLVPFGEYIPFRKGLPFLNKIATGISDFTPGTQPSQYIELYGIGAIMPFICFESAFDSLFINDIERNAIFILNITNDLWFGNSVGPYQHFTMSQIRAIEYGLPLVRVANSGISAVVDCYGRIELVCELNTEQLRDWDLRVEKAKSFYIDYALQPLVVLVVFLVFVFGIFFGLKIRNRKY